MVFFAATQPLRPAIKSLFLTVLVLIEVVEQSSRSLFKSLEDALRLDKDNRISSFVDVALGLPDLCLSATFPVTSSFFFKIFCTAQRLIFSFFAIPL